MNDNDVVLKRALDDLSFLQQTAFALLLCERQMPEFRKFSVDSTSVRLKTTP